MRKQTLEETMNKNKIKYFVIFRTLRESEDINLSTVFTIVEQEEIAKDWCERNSNYYYIERVCE